MGNARYIYIYIEEAGLRSEEGTEMHQNIFFTRINICIYRRSLPFAFDFDNATHIHRIRPMKKKLK